MNNLTGILKTIIDHKREELEECQRRRSVDSLKDWAKEQEPPRGFSRQLSEQVARKEMAVIAEIKRASPSRGVLREPFDPLAIANSYLAAGATCLSVLTDNKFFMGSGVILDLVRKKCPLPALRKDFIIDEYQIYESMAYGADCILLIATVTSGQQLQDLFGLAREQGMDVLVEVHSARELEDALKLNDLQLIGINNRNLQTFETDLQLTLDLVAQVPPDKLVISESGITKPADIKCLKDAGVYACLVGEAFMRADDPGAALKALLV